jgi:outer membrane immunogenic protein
VGWTAGTGVEYAFLDHWSAKIEYLYVDLGKATCDVTCSGSNPFDVTFKSSIVRGGVNYTF